MVGLKALFCIENLVIFEKAYIGYSERQNGPMRYMYMCSEAGVQMFHGMAFDKTPFTPAVN